MIINFPKVGLVKFPDDLSPEDFQSKVKSLSEKYGFELPSGHLNKVGFMPNLKAGYLNFLGASEEALGEHLGSESLLARAEKNKIEAAQTAEPMTDEDVARAKKEGFFSGLGAQLTQNITGPIGGIAGRYGPMIAAAPIVAAALPEEAAGIAIGVGARRLIGGAAADFLAESGENIQEQKVAHPGEKLNFIAADLTAAVQAGIANAGIPFVGKASKALTGELNNITRSFAPKVLAGEITKEAAAKEASNVFVDFINASISNAISGGAMMVGTEALRKGQAGEPIASPEALQEYKESLKSAAIMSPVFGGLHTAFRGPQKAVPIPEVSEEQIKQEQAKPTPQAEVKTPEVTRAEKMRDEANIKLATPEGTQDVIKNIKDYFFDYTKSDQNKIRTALQRRLKAFETKNEEQRAQTEKEYNELFSVIEPTPAEELTSQKLESVGIKGKLAFELRDKSLTDEKVYNKVADIANDLKNPNASAAAKLLDNIKIPEGVKDEGLKRGAVGASDEMLGGPKLTNAERVARGERTPVVIDRADMESVGGREKGINRPLEETIPAGFEKYEVINEDGTITSGFKRVGEPSPEPKKVVREPLKALSKEELAKKEQERQELLKREKAIADKMEAARVEQEDIYKSQPLEEEKTKLDLSTTAAPEELEGSKFQAKFKKAETLGDALKTLKKMPINKPQQALANILLNTKNVADVGFQLAKHPDARELTKTKLPKTFVGEFTGNVYNREAQPTRKLTRYEKFGGSYDRATNTAKLYQSGSVEHLLHEGVHAATADAIDKHVDHIADPRGPAYGVTPVGKSPLGKKLVKIYNAAVKAIKDRGATYAIDDMHEFFAEAHTNDGFKKLLKNTESVTKAKARGRLSSLWTDLISAVREMIGGPEKIESLLDDVMSISPEVFKGPSLEKAVLEINKGEEKVHFSRVTEDPTKESDVKEVLNEPTRVFDTIPKFDKASERFGDFWAKASDSVRHWYLGSMTLQNMHQLFGNIFPSISKLDDVVKNKNHYHVELRQHIDNLANNSIQTLQKFPKQVIDRFNESVLEMSRLNIDPKDAKNADNPYVKMFKSLDPKLQKIAYDIVDDYKNYSTLLIDSLAQNAGSKAAELRQKFESSRLPFYLPLLRRGNYWLQYMEKNGEQVSISKDSPKQIQRIEQYLRSKGITDIRTYSKLEDISHRQAPPTGFVAGIIDIMKQGGADEKALDRVYQSYLSLFPTESIRQSFRERKGDLGYIQDVVQGYARQAPKMAMQISNLKYAPQIDKVYGELNKEFEKNRSKTAVDVMTELKKRSDFINNPVSEWWAYSASNANFLMSIAGNLSSALVNTTVVPMVVLNHLAVDRNGNYNYIRAAKSLANAFKMYRGGGYDNSKNYMTKALRVRTFGENPNLPPEYKALYDAALNSGAITYSVGRDLHNMAEVPSDRYQNIRQKVGAALGLAFEGTERFNREVTLISAYDLARQDGFTPAEAIKKAIDLTSRVHTEAVPDAGPRWLQGQGTIGALQKTALTFKRFTLAQMLNLGMLLHESFKGDTTPEGKIAKKIAGKQLIGIIAATYAFSGVKGLPGYGAVNALANFILSDSDEGFDLDEYLRESVGEIGLTGPMNAFTGLDVASRTGYEGMIWREDRKRLSDVGYVAYAMEHLLGPTYTNLRNFEEGVKMMADGQTERGMEKFAPSFVRNPMKAFRFATEGALNRNGAPIIDNVDDYSKFMQVLGFTSAELSAEYAKTSAMKAEEKRVYDRRKALLDSYYLATSNGDSDAQDLIMDKIDKFNDIHSEPGVMITADTIQKSYRQREKAIEESVGGVHFNKKLMPYLEDKFDR